MKNIGILGSGNVAQSLAAGFLKNGYKVMLGTRTSSKLDDWKKQAGENAATGSFEETAKFGEILVLVVKGTVAKDVLKLTKAENLKGKTIIDATNPIADEAPVNGVLKFYTNINKSLMEELQEAFPTSNFVKSFNSVGSPLMVNPDFGGQKPTMFIAGNNTEAKNQVTEINTLFGWETEDMGKATAARAIEPLCILWCIPGMLENQWGHAFKLLKTNNK